MTMYGIPYLNICLCCREEFSPTEISNEFCSWDCEEKYWEAENATEHYNYGRK